jgi:hypothetical protein
MMIASWCSPVRRDDRTRAATYAFGTFKTCRSMLPSLCTGVDRKWLVRGKTDAIDPMQSQAPGFSR